MQNNLVELLDKYNVPGGRYTYYPFHAKWNNELSKSDWIKLIQREAPEQIDLYLHIPFCHSLCTFCGCNIKVMKSKCDNEMYIKTILREWKQYNLQSLVENIYIGGGTPNFLTPQELNELIKSFPLSDKTQITIEIDPRFITKDDLNSYRLMGINRLSIGIQDFNKNVLENVNRIQDEDEVINLINHAALIGFDYINLDFIFGLSYQTRETLKETWNKIKNINCTAISLYPFAKVPWQNNSQRAFGEIPDFTIEEMNQFQADAKEALEENGFKLIGMGHYQKQSQLHSKIDRNIMGFSTSTNTYLIGLGVSAISSTPFGHLQNEKVYIKYIQSTKELAPVFFKSHRKNAMEHDREIFFKRVICENFISFEQFEKFKLDNTEEKINALIADHLIVKNENGFVINNLGRYFHKTILQFFDPNFSGR